MMTCNRSDRVGQSECVLFDAVHTNQSISTSFTQFYLRKRMSIPYRCNWRYRFLDQTLVDLQQRSIMMFMRLSIHLASVLLTSDNYTSRIKLIWWQLLSLNLTCHDVYLSSNVVKDLKVSQLVDNRFPLCIRGYGCLDVEVSLDIDARLATEFRRR